MEEANWRADENDMPSDHEYFWVLLLPIPIIYSDGRVIQSKGIPALSHPDSFDEPPVTIPEA